jgi:hypothetical protein
MSGISSDAVLLRNAFFRESQIATCIGQRKLVHVYMNTNSQNPIGKVSADRTELGAPTRTMVEERARELARLDERNPNEFTEADWEQACVELTGGRPAGAPQDASEIAASLSERGSIPGETGSRAPRVMPTDESLLDARLASHGVEEAAHDQMVEAAKGDQEQEG